MVYALATGLDGTMRKMLRILGLSLCCSSAMGAVITVSSWTPIFQGVDLASGQQVGQTNNEPNLQLLCLRVDLTDPSIKFFTTPHCTNGCALETLSENTSRFLEQNGLQVAVNCGFYSPSDPAAIGVPLELWGLAISEGTVVSPADNPAFVSVILFSSNNVPTFVPTNSPLPDLTGVYTAIAGNHTLLTNGVNLMTPNPDDRDPRDAVGLSLDRRYLYLMTIDGRQTGWSDGTDFYTTGEWLKRFGATDGVNMDGGGSTTMVMANCDGGPKRLNRPSYVAAFGHERYVGHNFGIYALPLPSALKNLQVEPGTSTAVLTWGTDVPATTQVQYGLTTNYGSATPLDARLVHSHVATLTGLTAGATYYYRAISTTSELSLTQACQFSTTSLLVTTQVFDLTNVWAYNTNNLDGSNWTARTYDDAPWLGQGPGLLYVENSANVAPKNTALPPPFGQTIPRTYYFRTHFQCTNNLAGGALTLSNYVDDGAVFYLNGAELYRLRMPAAPATIVNSTAAITYPCSNTAFAGDAATICPDVFSVAGDVLTNLVSGDNVVAVEVHNYSSQDIVFGSALYQSTPAVVLPRLDLSLEDNIATFFWNGVGFTLQHSSALLGSGGWSNAPGPASQSPFVVTNPMAGFYRLGQ